MQRHLAASYLILVLGISVFSSATPLRATPLFKGPVDSYGNICWDRETTRLDNFAIAVERSEGWSGYIVVYAGRWSCAGEVQARLERARRWVVERRGVEESRVILKDGGFREDVTTELWLLPPGLSESERPVVPTLEPHEAKVIARCKGKIYKPAKCNNP